MFPRDYFYLISLLFITIKWFQVTNDNKNYSYETYIALSNLMLYNCKLFVCLFGFYGISTFVGYLMQNPFLYI